jgi:hypothetical protein
MVYLSAIKSESAITKVEKEYLDFAERKKWFTAK